MYIMTRELDWVLLGYGESTEGWDSGSLHMQLI